MSPKISVIIPVYNVEKYLSECVNSVLVQDFQNYEMILVDDGSTDNSGKICDEYASKYSQIKVIHKENGGLSDARNFGIKEAQGDYLMFLDSDDFWQGSNRLAEISSIIETQNQPDIILYGITPFFDSKENTQLNVFPSISSSKVTNDFQKDFKYLVENFIYKATGCDKVIKRDIVIDNQLFFPEGKLHEDVAWCYDIISYIKTYNVYSECFYCYRRERAGSITYRLREKPVLDIIDIVYKRVENHTNLEAKNTFLFLWGYINIIATINILPKDKYKIYFPKVKEMDFLLNQLPSRLTFRQKVRILVYRVLGIKLAGKLEYKLRYEKR